MFTVESAPAAFEDVLRSHGLSLDSMTPGAGFRAMLALYREHRAIECNVEEDGDMLLFQWGTYDWGQGPRFEFELARQLAPSGHEFDDVAHQLRLTFCFEPSEDLRSLGEGNRWCDSPRDQPSFEAYLAENPALQSVAHRSDGVVELRFGPVGWDNRRWLHFECAHVGGTCAEDSTKPP